MVRALVLVGAVVFAAAVHRVAVADDRKESKAAPADPTAELLAKLRQPVTLPAGEMSLAEFAAAVEKATGVGVAINERAFSTDGENGDPAELPVRPARFKGATAADVLRHTVARHGATFVVRRTHVEILPLAAARREAKLSTGTDGNGDPIEPAPLVSAVFKEKPVNEALAELAAEHDLTVVVAPQAGDHKTTCVSARLLNVPADKAVELLAVQADLRVVRRGAAFLVTSKDHAEQLFNERMDREQRKIELENARNPAFNRNPNNLPGFCGAIGFAGNLGGVAGFAGGQVGQPPPAPKDR